MMNSNQAATLTPPVNSRDHSRGPEDAPVALVEYGDFECPACGRAYPIVKALCEQMGDRLRLVFREFPLRQAHPHAEAAAEAAEGAGVRRAFWPMHDLLFTHQDALTPRDLAGYAAQLGLDARQFAAEMQAHRFAPAVEEDLQSGMASGVQGTPTFYINGVPYQGPVDADGLRSALEQAAEAPAGR